MSAAAVAVGVAAGASVLAFGGFRWVIRDMKAEKFHDRTGGVLARFEDVRVTRTQLLVGTHHAPTRYPVHGLHATVETSGQLQHRITATRVAAVGVFAVAWQKKRDDRSVFLVVEGPGVAVVREIYVKGGTNVEAKARGLAAAINAQAMLPAPPTTPPRMPAEPEDAIPPGF